MASIKAKVKGITRGATDLPLAAVLHRPRPVLRGWANYFHHGVSSQTFSYLDAYIWRRVAIWLRGNTGGGMEVPPPALRLFRGGPVDGEVTLFRTGSVAIERYRYRAPGFLRRGHELMS